MDGPAAPWTVRLLREPLVHFLVIGLALFAVYRARRPAPPAATRRIVLTQGDLDRMTAEWRAEGRPAPSPEQMQALLEARIREEVLCREALDLGLDRDDAILQHRLAEKMDLLAEAGLREPPREELEAFLKDNPKRFEVPPLASFRHLYFSFDLHGEDTEKTAAEALKRIAGKPVDTPDAEGLSDPFMLDDAYADRSPDRVAAE
ncbi:MAG: peptidyl-prolyl cis-trans isomerase, partial [Planctomycetota bacterium]